MSKLWLKYENWSEQENQSRVYRYRSNMYRYMLATNDQNPKGTGTCSRCTGTCHPKMPRMCIFSHFSCTFIHKSLLMHPSSKTNMESLPTTPQTLLVCKRILGFIPKLHPILQILGIVKDSISTHYQSTKLPLNLELECLPSKTLEKGTKLISK